MYKVWFVDYCGHHHLEEVFNSSEEAEAYIDEANEYLSCEEYMYIEEK